MARYLEHGAGQGVVHPQQMPTQTLGEEESRGVRVAAVRLAERTPGTGLRRSRVPCIAVVGKRIWDRCRQDGLHGVPAPRLRLLVIGDRRVAHQDPADLAAQGGDLAVQFLQGCIRTRVHWRTSGIGG